MKTALTVVFIIASILLIILVLMQEGKEAGLGSLTGATESGTYWSKNKGRSKEGTLI
ncbi:preprotein translocase subunit SecG, partial [Anaerostipes sp.]